MRLLPTPVLAKWFLPFYLPRIDSILIVRPGFSSLVFHTMREHTTTNVSVGRDSDYRACTF